MRLLSLNAVRRWKHWATWCAARGSHRLLWAVILIPVSMPVAAVVWVDIGNAGESRALFPSDLFTVPDSAQLTGRRIALPKPDCNSRPSDCEDVDQLNELDGFSVQPRIAVPFSGDIDASSVSAESVFLLELRLSRHIALNQLQWYAPTRELIAQPNELLKQRHRYLLVVTTQVRDNDGAPLDPAPFWAALQQLGSKPSAATFARSVVMALAEARWPRG